MVVEQLVSEPANMWWFYIQYSPDDQRLLAVGMDAPFPDMSAATIAYVFDAITGTKLKSFDTGNKNWIRTLTWSSDGSKLATGHYNNEVIIWDYQTGKQITKLIDPGMLVAVFWSPDGSKLLESGLGALAYVWDTSTWKMLYQLSDIEPPSAYQSLDWSPDGSRILAGAGNDDAGAKDNTARIWDSRTGEQLLVVSSHTRMILSVDWSPDGSRFATASADGTTRIWDASTGSELLTLKTPSLYFEFVRWSPDGKHLVSGGTNSPPAVWRVWQSKEELIEYAKQCCVIRELTPEERQQFGLE